MFFAPIFGRRPTTDWIMVGAHQGIAAFCLGFKLRYSSNYNVTVLYLAARRYRRSWRSVLAHVAFVTANISDFLLL